MGRFLLFINGINTKLGDFDAWHYRAERWVERQPNTDRADTYAYHVRTLDRWLYQSGHVDRAAAILMERSGITEDLIVCGHSNGCAIACAMLAKHEKLRLAELHLIAGAVDDSFDTNGLNAAVERNQVGRIVLYCSEKDSALEWARKTHWVNWLNAKWGYGHLGLTGPRDMTRDANLRTVVKWNQGYDHGTYFDPMHFEQTMRDVTAGYRIVQEVPTVTEDDKPKETIV